MAILVAQELLQSAGTLTQFRICTSGPATALLSSGARRLKKRQSWDIG